MTIRTPSLWGWVRNTIAWIVKTVLGDPMASKVVLSEKVRSVEEFWKLTVERDEYVKLIYKTIWDEHNLDGIICPVIATPALPHTAVSFVGGIANSTILYNIVDSPVGVIPVTRVNPSLDNLTPEWTNHSIGSGHGSSLFEGLLYKGEKAIYDAKKMEGLPVGIQIVGRRWEEEKVIGMMKVVEEALKTMRKLELEGVDSVKSNINENLKDVDNGYTRVSKSLGHVHGNASL
ncbi:Amidase signature (AS) superfamily protein [Abortiporus biennis]